jgi:hypothetical protein
MGLENVFDHTVRSIRKLAERAVLLPRAPSDIIGGNRTTVADGDELIPPTDVWRGQFADPAERKRLQTMSDAAEAAADLDAADHRRPMR